VFISILNITEVQATVIDNKMLYDGETSDIGGGYTLTATEIDNFPSLKRVTLTLSENGVVLKKEILTPGQTFIYEGVISAKVDSVLTYAINNQVKLIDVSIPFFYNFNVSSTNPSTLIKGDKYTILVSIKNEVPKYSGQSTPLNCKVETGGVWSNEYKIDPQSTVDIPLPTPLVGGNGMQISASCYRPDEPTIVRKKNLWIGQSFKIVENPETSSAEQNAISAASTYSATQTPNAVQTAQVNLPSATSTPYVVQTIAQGMDKQVNLPSANPTPGFGLLLMIVTMGMAMNFLKKKK
jgi:hypothetical protein